MENTTTYPTKRCSSCKETKLLSEFNLNKCNKDGLQYQCRVCTKITNDKYAATHREENRARARQWAKDNPDKVSAKDKRNRPKRRQYFKEYSAEWYATRFTIEHQLYSKAKVRAKKEELPFNLEKEDMVVPTHCPVLGLEIKRSDKGFDPNSPSLDKFVPSKGYVKGNVAVISNRANILKKDASFEEIEKLYFWMKSQTEKSNSLEGTFVGKQLA